MRILDVVSLGAVALTLCSTALGHPGPVKYAARNPNDFIVARADNANQTVVTWDEFSLSINGERVFIWSGEVHPWRLPVVDYWLDVFEKIKALGLNAVSFYVHWGLVEYQRGDFNFEGIRDLQPFFDAASQAGIYLLARPGPYINAETTGGGLPGWGTRVEGAWRTNDTNYINASTPYLKTVGAMIADNQITKGGPIILVQPENEFSSPGPGIPWPQQDIMQIIMDTYRSVGVEIPFILNDVSPSLDNYAPGSGEGAVDIYGYDAYPMGFDCSDPSNWGTGRIPTNFWMLHLQDSPSTQNAIMEFQGGSFDPWGGPGYDKCAALINNEFDRVFYKNLLSASTTLLNLYMMYGGTNWGGLAYPGVYTSYDYGSSITESRTVDREKYSELKLEANFIKVSPAFLTTRPQNLDPVNINGQFTNNSAIAVTQTSDVVGNKTVFWTVRQADYTSEAQQSYKLQVPTSAGNLSIPQLQGSLTLTGRDSKIHVTDYSLGNTTILYSTGEIFTWKTFGTKQVVVLYGSAGETHETAFITTATNATAALGDGLQKVSATNGTVIINYVTSGQTVVEIGPNLLVYLVDRNTAYNFWVPDLPGNNGTAFSTENSVIVRGGYLIRSATVSGSTLQIRGDLNASTALEIFAGDGITSFTFNGENINLTESSYGSFTGQLTFSQPDFSLPEFASLDWKTADSLPEIVAGYDDSPWVSANLTSTPNPRNLTTPTSLYSNDYGYEVGNVLWRGHFTASGSETGINVTVQGGSAFGFSVWLNSTFVGSYLGRSGAENANLAVTFPSNITAGNDYVVTILQDITGLDEDGVGSNEFKTPRGILSYDVLGTDNTEITWKVTGNLGGENYTDRVRGALNEGGLFAERQGWHLPGFNTSDWASGTPFDGISQAGVGFFKTDFSLNLPEGFDIPLAFAFANSSTALRAQLYVNGYQMGRYFNALGPQTVFPVHQGILNYNGTNSLGISIWAQESIGASLGGLNLTTRAVVQTSFGPVGASPQPPFTPRPGAF